MLAQSCTSDTSFASYYEDGLIALYQEAALDNGFEVHKVGNATLLISPDPNSFSSAILGEIRSETFSYIQTCFPARKFYMVLNPARNDLCQIALDNGYSEIETETEMMCDIADFKPCLIKDTCIKIVQVNSAEQLHEWCAVKNEIYAHEDACDFFECSLQSPNIIRYVGYYDGEPIAIAKMFICGSCAHFYLVAVKEKLRNRGIGSAIIQECLQLLCEKNVQYIIGSASLLGRPLYEKMGAKVIGEKRYFLSSKN